MRLYRPTDASGTCLATGKGAQQLSRGREEEDGRDEIGAGGREREGSGPFCHQMRAGKMARRLQGVFGEKKGVCRVYDEHGGTLYNLEERFTRLYNTSTTCRFNERFKEAFGTSDNASRRVRQIDL